MELNLTMEENQDNTLIISVRHECFLTRAREERHGRMSKLMNEQIRDVKLPK